MAAPPTPAAALAVDAGDTLTQPFAPAADPMLEVDFDFSADPVEESGSGSVAIAGGAVDFPLEGDAPAAVDVAAQDLNMSFDDAGSAEAGIGVEIDVDPDAVAAGDDSITEPATRGDGQSGPGSVAPGSDVSGAPRDRSDALDTRAPAAAESLDIDFSAGAADGGSSIASIEREGAREPLPAAAPVAPPAIPFAAAAAATLAAGAAFAASVAHRAAQPPADSYAAVEPVSPAAAGPAQARRTETADAAASGRLDAIPDTAALLREHEGAAPSLSTAAGDGVADMSWQPAAALPAIDPTALSDADLRARGFDPAERLLARIEDEIDPQLLPIFLEEAAELVPQLGQQLRAWASQPGNLRNAQALQRTLHTLKGSARMAGAMALGQVTHSMETRIENSLSLPMIPPTIMDGLVSSYDRVNLLFEALRGGASLEATAPTADHADAAAIDGVGEETPAASPGEVAATAEAGVAAVVPPAAAAGAVALANQPGLPPAQAAASAAAEDVQRAMLRVRADLIDRLVNEAGEVAIARSRIEGEMRAVKSSLRDLTESVNRLRGQLREIELAADLQMQSRQREAEVKNETFDPLEFDRFTRFQEVTRMMAESVNDVATVQQNLFKNVDDADLAVLAQARLTRDLQGDLMRVRMVPFNNVAERLHRVVRQTAKELGKRANLDIRGVRIEIDRAVLERMVGPFEHLLRNAVAHGVEAPATRVAAGKQEIGQIALTARQEGNEFILVLEDDGRGLDLAKIRERAIAAGLLRAGDAPADAQVAEFIFAPGFSTADEISAISGRGIGMDVVRSEVVALGGRIDTEFTAGRGTRFTIALPLTLAVTQVVLVRAGPHLYAIPSVTVEQVRQTRAQDLEQAYAAGGVRWQERDYPLFYLPRLLGEAGQQAPAQRFTPLLLVRSGTQRAAIQVDTLVANQEVVVKNIGPQLARVTGIGGATVLGNGDIVLILNPVPLALQAVSSGIARSGVVLEADAEGGANAPGHLLPPPAPLVMVVDDSLTVRKITSRLLARENYQVLTARDGVDALEQLQGVRPDIMLVDIEMPRMDGFDLTRNVRADAALKHIPIIMITSRTAEKHRKYALEVGVNAFLGKPFQEDELLENIALLVRKAAVTA